jgi:hypothetical protein
MFTTHSIIAKIHQHTTLTDEQEQTFHEERSRICKRLGLHTKDYDRLCLFEQWLHRWHEAECNGFIQRDEPTDIPWGYSPDRYNSPIIRSSEPLPDEEKQWIREATLIAAQYNLKVYVQTDPRGCALHLYRDDDLDGRDICECYSSRATAVGYPRH